MKLVRLLSPANTDTNIAGQKSDYYVNFQEPFEIKPNAKVSLQNFSIVLEDQLSVIASGTGKNNVFTMTQQDTASLDDPTADAVMIARMNADSYEIADFQSELIRAMNYGLRNPLSDPAIPVEDDSQFIEMNASLTDKQQLKISYELLKKVKDTHLTFAFIETDGGDPASYTKEADADEDTWSFAYTNQGSILTKGQGFAQIQMNSGGSGVSGWAFGLVDYNIANAQNTGQPFSGLEPIQYYHSVFAQGSKYWTATSDGEITANTGVDVIEGDIIQIGQGRNTDIDGQPSEIVFQVKREDGGNIQTIARITNDSHDRNYNIAFSILNSDITLSGFQFVETGTNATKATASDKYFNLSFDDFASNLLGFTSRSTPLINTASSGSWTADLIIYTSIIPSSVVIEIPTLSIASYDGDENFQRRRSLIGVIPATQLDIQKNSLSYSQPYPVFLDIQNNATQLINSLRVRILDTNNNALVMSTQPKSASVCVIFD
jgi:hypothetical protein